MTLQFLQTKQDNFVVFVPLDEDPGTIQSAFNHTNGTVQADMFSSISFFVPPTSAKFYDISPLTQVIYSQSITNTFTKNGTTYKAFYITETDYNISITSTPFNPTPNSIVGVTQFMS